MTEADTQPRIELRPAGVVEGEVGLLTLAGHAQAGVPRGARRLNLVLPELLIGREYDSCLPYHGVDDPFLSRRHARISLAPAGGHCVSDLDSTNGTWLDGTRISPGAQHRLRDGAVMMMGAHVFVFRRVTPEDLAAMREDAANPFAPVPTQSPRMAALASKLRRLAPTRVDLLLTGETGVGKEVHAEAIHRASRRPGSFTAINCAALPETLVESELFGYARGAHSTADRPKPGLLEQADGGTLFLDEIGEMAHAAQTKLLRFLQSRQVLSLGATRARELDVRVLAATHRSVSDEGERGLRYDLAARLGPEPLTVPPLRERIEDIGLLARHLCEDDITLEPEAYLALFLHVWKGNVRELDKVLAVARVLATGAPAIRLVHLPAEIGARVDTGVRPGRRGRPTRTELATLLTAHRGDVARVARQIGRQRTLVWRWLREESLRADDYR